MIIHKERFSCDLSKHMYYEDHNHTLINTDCVQYKKYNGKTPDIFRCIESKYLTEGIYLTNTTLDIKKTQYGCLKFQSDIDSYYPKDKTLCQSFIITSDYPNCNIAKITDVSDGYSTILTTDKFKDFLSFKYADIRDFVSCMSEKDFLDYREKSLNDYKKNKNENENENDDIRCDGVYGYFVSPINKFIHYNIPKNHICTHIDMIQLKNFSNGINMLRIIETNPLTQSIPGGQEEVMRFQAKKCLYYCNDHKNTHCQVIIIQGDEPYNFSKITNLMTGESVIVNRLELFKWLTFEKLYLSDLKECMSLNEFESYIWELKRNDCNDKNNITNDQKKYMKSILDDFCLKNYDNCGNLFV